MGFQYIDIIVLFLLGLVTVNLFLTIKLMKAVSSQTVTTAEEQPLAIGSVIAPFSATIHIQDKEVELSDYGFSRVLIFLNSQCPSCKEKIGYVEQLLQLSENEGLVPLLITAESFKRFNAFLEGRSLVDHLLNVDEQTYSRLNPQGASPAYLFVSDLNIVEAEGMIGDENWQGLIEQLTAIKEQAINEEFNKSSL